VKPGDASTAVVQFEKSNTHSLICATKPAPPMLMDRDKVRTEAVGAKSARKKAALSLVGMCFGGPRSNIVCGAGMVAGRFEPPTT
jgi:hypothetical protein